MLLVFTEMITNNQTSEVTSTTVNQSSEVPTTSVVLSSEDYTTSVVHSSEDTSTTTVHASKLRSKYPLEVPSSILLPNSSTSFNKAATMSIIGINVLCNLLLISKQDFIVIKI